MQVPPADMDALRLFNEKAQQLLDNRFTKHVLENSTSFKFTGGVNEPLQVELNIPDEDALKAFVLTVRFFCQNSERTSLSNMAAVYDRLPIPQEAKDRLHQSRQLFNEYLDAKSNIKFRDEDLYNRTIWDTFLYGELAHSDPEKKAVYDSWMATQVMAEFVKFRFCSVLIEWIGIVKFIRELNIMVLSELERDWTAR